MNYDLDEKSAFVRRLALHAHKALSPSEYRRAGAGQADTIVGSRAIKGNISRLGARIYHLKWQKEYAGTRNRKEQGELFCSGAEAQAAEWRAVWR